MMIKTLQRFHLFLQKNYIKTPKQIQTQQGTFPQMEIKSCSMF